MEKGLVIAGNLLVDKIKMIESYPEKGMLSTITDIKNAVGGAVPNTGIDLKIIDKELRVQAYGLIGADSDGEFIAKTLERYGVETANVKKTELPTSFTDVMTVKSTGERTFFHNRGANQKFMLSDAEIDALDCDIFHIGYILLLDELDKPDDEYGTAMARLLCKVQQRGIKTSIDVVSENGKRFKKIVTPALKYCNYVIINEIESAEVSSIPPRDKNGDIIIENIRKTMEMFFEKGVKDKVIIHCPEMGLYMDSDKEFTVVTSFDLPKGYILGTVGAGDAFCAGSLYGIYKNFAGAQLLEFASACSACNLSKEDSISGMRDYAQIIKFEKEHPRRHLNNYIDL